MSDLTDLRDGMRRFTDERDWARFHDPKSLVLALMGEVGEVAELLQWLPADEAVDRLQNEPLKTRVAEELSDVLLYLVRLADVLDVDLAAAAGLKLKSSEARFHSGEFYGRAPEKH
jgi:dCTP diphosphatase